MLLRMLSLFSLCTKFQFANTYRTHAYSDFGHIQQSDQQMHMMSYIYAHCTHAETANTALLWYHISHLCIRFMLKTFTCSIKWVSEEEVSVLTEKHTSCSAYVHNILLSCKWILQNAIYKSRLTFPNAPCVCVCVTAAFTILAWRWLKKHICKA